MSRQYERPPDMTIDPDQTVRAILHTERGQRHYTALFSNTPRAHRLGRTDDWVILYCEGGDGERQYTVVTAPSGPLRGRRVVRGREAACTEHYRAMAAG